MRSRVKQTGGGSITNRKNSKGIKHVEIDVPSVRALTYLCYASDIWWLLMHNQVITESYNLGFYRKMHCYLQREDVHGVGIKTRAYNLNV